MTLVHDGLIHESSDELVDALVPFLLDGLSREQGVVVAASERTTDVLTAGLGRDAGRVVFAPADMVYETPHGAINAYHGIIRRFLREGRTGVCAVGEVAYGSTKASQDMWLRYEPIAHAVFEQAPLHVVCPYDAQVLPPSILEHARKTHPMLVRGSSRSACETYVEPEPMLRSLPQSPPLTPATAPDFVIERPGDVRDVRVALERFLRSVLAEPRASEALVACGELLANAAHHGRGRAFVTAWADAEAVIVRISNEGPPIADPFAGYRLSANQATGGMGLWLARQMSDEFVVESEPHGPSVTVAFRGARR